MHRWNGRLPQRRGNWLVGCGIVLAVALVLFIAVGVFVAMNARSWTAKGLNAGLTNVIDQLPIDDTEKAESRAVVDGFIQDFRDGDVTFVQLTKIFEELTKGSAMPAAAALGVGSMYFHDKQLDETLKADGMNQVARIAHGLSNKALDPDDLPDILEPLLAKATESNVIQFNLPDGRQYRLKAPQSATADDLRAFIESARSICDEKELPALPPAFDLSSELQHAIDVGTGKALPDEQPGDSHAGSHAGSQDGSQDGLPAAPDDATATSPADPDGP